MDLWSPTRQLALQRVAFGETRIDQNTTPADITGAPLVFEFDERELHEWARTLFVGL
ncbi:uncharacterized protein ACHE_21133A [Aspergillus chevalieri]|uniref:Uncharacterized protein n=1 Tax=Aspergillus chevalieri TaxID=182096 RepID=A0A7R7VJ58_ASPCH|nr:uncharacterized protein ACHE_21133A [Aspergillus chevalieri]BCR85675.1 hypothetical protein ACHE_21133A [Aspergillus chevalieri]